MFDQTQIRLHKCTLDTNDCYFRRLFLIEMISIDNLMAVEENGLKETINHTIQSFNTYKIKEYIYILQIKNFFIYGVRILFT